VNLRNETLLAIGITFICIFIVALAIALPLTLAGLGHLENQEGLEEVLQTKSALDSELSYLWGTTLDWARWDEMDQFVLGQNPGFEEHNLNRESLANIRVNVLIIENTSKTILITKSLSADFSREISTPETTIRLIARAPLAMLPPGEEHVRSGIVMLPEGPMMVTFSSILPSSADGPSHGTLIIGRYLESGGVLSRISSVTGFPVRLVNARDTGLQLSEQETLAPIAGVHGMFVSPVNETVLNGILPLTDINGQDLLLVTEIPRTLYHSSLVIVGEFFLLFLLSAIATMVVVAIILDRNVLQPLNRLNGEVRTYKMMSGDISPPVIIGNNELAQLEEAIRSSHKNLAESEMRFRQIVETAREGICTLDGNRTITFANDQLAAMLGYPREEIIGKPFKLFIFPDDLADLDSHIMMTREGSRDLYEGRLVKNDRSVLWVLISTTPVMAEQAWVGSYAMITDITDRKLTEDALQQATRKLSLLNAVTFNDIQNAVFTLSGYMELEKANAKDEKTQARLEKQKSIVRTITGSLNFAADYQSLGIKPPIWQNVSQSFLLGISHLDPMKISRRLEVDNIEIFADPLLENVFLSLVENVMVHAATATEISFMYNETPEGLLLLFTDNGPGVPAMLKQKIFERRSEKKRGLGLFLVKEILGITGIGIHETGEPGMGARFEILVPRGAYRFVKKQAIPHLNHP
jgi:PAS domain S-box-containing protein